MLLTTRLGSLKSWHSQLFNKLRKRQKKKIPALKWWIGDDSNPMMDWRWLQWPRIAKGSGSFRRKIALLLKGLANRSAPTLSLWLNGHVTRKKIMLCFVWLRVEKRGSQEIRTEWWISQKVARRALDCAWGQREMEDNPPHQETNLTWCYLFKVKNIQFCF